MTRFDVHLADVLWRRDPSGRVRPIASFTPTQADGRDVSEAAFGTLAGFEALNPSYADVLTVDASTDPATVVSDQGGGTIAVRVPQWYNGVETMRAGDDLFAPAMPDWEGLVRSQLEALTGGGLLPERLVPKAIAEMGDVTAFAIVSSSVSGRLRLRGYTNRTLDDVRCLLEPVADLDMGAVCRASCVPGMTDGDWDAVLAKTAALSDEEGIDQCDVLLSLDDPYAFAAQIHSVSPDAARALAQHMWVVGDMLEGFRSAFGRWPAPYVPMPSKRPKVVLSGWFPDDPEDMAARLEANGWQVVDAVSRDVRYVVAGVGASNGYKARSARRQGIEVLAVGRDVSKAYDVLLADDRPAGTVPDTTHQ